MHDLLVRGIYGLLTEMALLDDEGAELLALRDRLLPDGISAAIHASYRAQAGYAALLRERLTPDVRDALAGIALRRGNLLERVEAWLAAAQRLGALEEERARLEAPEGASVGMQTAEARNGWVRVVNAFVSVAALAQLDESTDRLVFGPLRDAEARADQRAARRRASAAGNPAQADATSGEAVVSSS